VTSSTAETGSRDGVEALLDYRFGNPDLLEEALTHGSATGDRGAAVRDYDMLEFLGDAVLELVTRDYLMKLHPLETEGELTRRKASIVSSDSLASAGKRIGLADYVRMGSEFDSTGCPDSVIADAVEALIGAVYRDGGFDEAGRVAVNLVLRHSGSAGSGPSGDPKSRLQELLQSEGRPLPRYVTSLGEGPGHEPVFRCLVKSRGSVIGSGTGSSKRKAQQAAAADALSRLEG